MGVGVPVAVGVGVGVPVGVGVGVGVPVGVGVGVRAPVAVGVGVPMVMLKANVHADAAARDSPGVTCLVWDSFPLVTMTMTANPIVRRMTTTKYQCFFRYCIVLMPHTPVKPLCFYRKAGYVCQRIVPGKLAVCIFRCRFIPGCGVDAESDFGGNASRGEGKRNRLARL